MLRGMVWQLFGGGSSSRSNDAAEEAGEAGGGDDEPAPWVVVLTVFEQVQATIAAARLRDEGIPVRIRHEAVSSVLPVNIGILGRIDLMVPGVMAEKALAILEDLEALDVVDDELPPGAFGDDPDQDI